MEYNVNVNYDYKEFQKLDKMGFNCLEDAKTYCNNICEGVVKNWRESDDCIEGSYELYSFVIWKYN